MQWFFTLIKFLFMLVISISGIWWHKAGLTKQIGTFHTLVFVVASPIFNHMHIAWYTKSDCLLLSQIKK